MKKTFDDLGSYLYILTNASLCFLLFYLNRTKLLLVVNTRFDSLDIELFNIYYLLLFSGSCLAFLITHMVCVHFMRAKIFSKLLFTFEALFILYCIADIKLFSLMGIHLGNPIVLDSLLAKNANYNLQLNVNHVLIFILFLLAICLMQFILWNIFKIANKLQNKNRYIFSIFILCFSLGVFLYSLPAIKKIFNKSFDEVYTTTNALMAYNLLFKKSFGYTEKLNVLYPRMEVEKFAKSKFKRHKNILLILVESLRGDSFVTKYMPNAVRFKNTHNCLKSENHFSGGHDTTFGIFSFLYGLNGYHYYPFSERKILSAPLQILRQNGYGLYGIASSPIIGFRGMDFITTNFDDYKEITSDTDKFYKNDQSVVDSVREFYKNYNSQKPFLLFIFLYSTHHNYYFPKSFLKFKPVIDENYNHLSLLGDDEPTKDTDKEKIFNRYKNSVGYVDHLFQQLVNIFQQEINKDNLVIFLSGDHGEEFWDNGLLGHARVRFTNARIRTPFLFCLPQAPKRQLAISSHVDILPTIIDYSLPDPKIPIESFSDGRSLLDKHDKEFLVVTGNGYPQTTPLLALVTKRNNRLWLKNEKRYDQFKLIKITSGNDQLVKNTVEPQAGELIRQLSLQMHMFLQMQF